MVPFRLFHIFGSIKSARLEFDNTFDMDQEKPLVNSEYLLQKFPGKGGWTYAEIPEILQNRKNPFGWVKVKGHIDTFELEYYKLMPMGNGKLFLPVKAAIRKRIGKQEGDYVKIVLYANTDSFEIPDEIIACFNQEPKEIYSTFLSFTEGEQKAYLDWVYNAKTDQTKVDRILKMINRLQKKLKYYDKE